MKKKLAALVCGILCVCLLSAPVYAAGESRPQDESGDGPAITITEGDASGEAVTPGTEPVSTTRETAGGVPTITKVYELPQGTDTGGLTASFEQDGYLFTRHDVSEQVRDGQADSKTVTQTETVESESGKIADIVAEAAPLVLYSEDGYTGQLALDVAAIVVEENGTASYGYRIEDVREYTNLDRNDAAYIPKTVLKNGATLQLEGIEWVVMGQHPVDGRMVPNLFKAFATYAGTAAGSRASGYTAILTYTGEVTKTTPGLCVYTVVFRGEPLAAVSEANPSASEPAATSGGAKKDSGVFLFILVATILLAAGCLAVAGVRIVKRIREGRGEDYTTEDFSDYGGGGEPAPVEPVRAEPAKEDTQLFERQFPQEAQTYPVDEYNIDKLFNDEEFFNE